MNRVVHFEIGAEEPERAMDFYKSLFGWKIEKWDGPYDYWLISTGDSGERGIDGGLYIREKATERSKSMSSAINAIVTVEVEDIEKTISLIKENGGEIIQDRGEIPMIGWLAYARDTEGNIFGVMQSSPESQM